MFHLRKFIVTSRKFYVNSTCFHRLPALQSSRNADRIAPHAAASPLPLDLESVLPSDTHNRSWLFRFLNQPLARTPHVRQLLARVVRLAEPRDLSDPGPGAANEKAAYSNSRAGAAWLGKLAFLYRTQGSPLHHDPATLAQVIEGFRIFRKQQDRQGRFIWGEGHYYKFGVHEHIWRLEPLLYARIWLDEYLAPADRKLADQVIHNAIPYIRTAPKKFPNATLQTNNRGHVWLAGAVLAGLYLNDKSLIHLADQHADELILTATTPAGEVCERTIQYGGGGPCSNYSYTGWAYLMLWRLLRGSSHLDDRLIQCVRWLANWNTRSGYPLAAAASVRRNKPIVGVFDVAPALEFFAGHEPAFQSVLTTWLKQRPNLPAEHGNGHCVDPLIFTALIHSHPPLAHVPRPQEAASTRPAWRLNSEQHLDHPSVQYSTFNHRYQAGITFRSNFPFKGLQCFAWGDEPPVIHPSDTLASTLVMGKTRTAETNLSPGANGWDIFRRSDGRGLYEPSADGTAITARRENAWEIWIATAGSLILFAGGSKTCQARWVLNALSPTAVTLDKAGKKATFAGRKAVIHCQAGGMTLGKVEGQAVLQARQTQPLMFAFADDAFRFVKWNSAKQLLRFRDASGSYEVDLSTPLNDKGVVNRNWHRLKKVK